MSVRSDILANIETVLTAVAGLSTVEVGRIQIYDVETMPPLPAAFVLQGPERKTTGSTEMEVWDWTVTVEIWCKDTDLEAFHAAVHAALTADIERGGKAINTVRQGSTPLVVDPGRSLGGFQQEYQIQYRHPLGSP